MILISLSGLKNSTHPLAASGNSRRRVNFLICSSLRASENCFQKIKKFAVCVVETGKSHIHKGISFILSGNIVIDSLKLNSVKSNAFP